MAKKGSSKRKINKIKRAQLNVQTHRIANEELADAMRGKRSSNAAQPHVPSHRKGTRAKKNQAAIKEYA